MTTQCDQIIIHGPVLEHYNNAGRACVKHSKKRREGSVGATCKKLALGALRCGHAGCRKCSVCVCVICPSPLIAAYAVATVRGPIALILKISFSEERTAKNEIALIQKNFHLPCSVCILELDVSCEECPAGLPLKPMTMNDL